MKSFREIALSEGVKNWSQTHEDLYKFFEDVMIDAKKLGKNKIVYRGFGNGGTMAGVAFVENDRNSFYGALDGQAAELLKELKIKNPAFGARDKIKASMFGAVYIMVPKGKFKAFQSPEHTDLLSGFRKGKEYNIKDIAKTYKETLDDINSQEIIFDTNAYYLMDMEYVLKELDKGNKFQKHTGDSIKTYTDLYYSLKSFVSFAKFKKNNPIR